MNRRERTVDEQTFVGENAAHADTPCRRPMPIRSPCFRTALHLVQIPMKKRLVGGQAVHPLHVPKCIFQQQPARTEAHSFQTLAP